MKLYKRVLHILSILTVILLWYWLIVTLTDVDFDNHRIILLLIGLITSLIGCVLPFLVYSYSLRNNLNRKNIVQWSRISLYIGVLMVCLGIIQFFIPDYSSPILASSFLLFGYSSIVTYFFSK